MIDPFWRMPRFSLRTVAAAVNRLAAAAYRPAHMTSRTNPLAVRYRDFAYGQRMAPS